MSQETYLTADTHFCHSKAAEWRADDLVMEPGDWEDMNEELIYRWNQTVRPQDIVWHLGDFALCSGEDAKKRALEDVLQRLNGTIHLVMGNHDRYDLVGKYMDSLWGVKERKQMLLSHIPVARAQADRFKANIHGHLHTHEMTDVSIRYELGEGGVPFAVAIEGDPDPFYYCVSVEQHGYAPVHWAEVRAAIRERQNGVR